MTTQASTQLKMIQAYDLWCSTGKLTDDNFVVKALYEKFRLIADVALGIDDYYLMAKDANENANKLADILKARGVHV